MVRTKTFSIGYLEDILESRSNVKYCSEEEGEDEITEYITIFSDVDGKFYKIQYKIDSTGIKYPNPWKTQKEIECIEVEKKQRLRHCADGRTGVYFDIYEEDWLEVKD